MDLDLIRKRHTRVSAPAFPSHGLPAQDYCGWCRDNWPCEQADLVAQIDDALQKIAHWDALLQGRKIKSTAPSRRKLAGLRLALTGEPWPSNR